MINQHRLGCGNLGLIIRGQTCECAMKLPAAAPSGDEEVQTTHGEVRIQWGDGSPAGRNGFLMTFTPNTQPNR